MKSEGGQARSTKPWRSGGDGGGMIRFFPAQRLGQ